MNQKIYIAYGSNMNRQQMKCRCPNAKLLGTGILRDYRLTFRNHGVANIEQAPGEQVPVLIWLITDVCERALDTYEGFPVFYLKKNIDIIPTMLGIFNYSAHGLSADQNNVATIKNRMQRQASRPMISGMAYVMAPAAAREYGRPRESYFNCIREAYEHNDFDQDILCSAYDIADAQCKTEKEVYHGNKKSIV